MGIKTWVCNIAAKQALKSTYPVYQHGCAIEQGGKIVAHGVNMNLHPVPQRDKKTHHAECVALRRAGKRAIGAILYVVRVTKGRLANSKPCPRCQEVIRASGIKKVVYSIADHEYGVMDIEGMKNGY